MKTRLTVVDSAFRRKSHDDVLVEERKVVCGSFNVIAPSKYFPRSDTGKSLSRRRCKHVFKPFVLRSSGACCEPMCVEVKNEGLKHAFASTPRERFTGIGPWKIFAGGNYVETPTDDLA